MAAADPSSGGKPLLRRPIFWVSAAAVIVLIAVVVGVAATSKTPRSRGLQRPPRFRLDRQAPQKPLVPRVAAVPRVSGSTKGSGSTSNAGKTSNTGNTTKTQPSQLPIGGTASFSDGGAPVYDLTVTQFVDPAQPAQQGVTPKNPGDIFVAVALTFKNTGTAEVSQDIYNDTKLYDSTGQGYDGNFEATASGPSFPVGIVSNGRGGTTSGWIMFEVPASSTGFKATFTPTEGEADQAAATWKLS